MDKIAIVGNGFVGNAIHQGIKEHFDVLIYDIDVNRRTHSVEDIDKLEILFICVPTPMTPDGHFDVSILNSAITKLSPGKILIIKSTITPASAEGLIECFPEHNLIFNPEFLTERTAVKDFQNPSRIVLGGNDQDSLQKSRRNV